MFITMLAARHVVTSREQWTYYLYVAQCFALRQNGQGSSNNISQMRRILWPRYFDEQLT